MVGKENQTEEQEADRKRDEALLRALKMPPKPHRSERGTSYNPSHRRDTEPKQLITVDYIPDHIDGGEKFPNPASSGHHSPPE